MTARLALPVLLALAAGACGADAPREAAVEADPVVLFPDDPGRTRIGALRYLGGVALTSEHDAFGGWSAMEMSEDGERLLALSDSGAWLTARLQMEHGAPTGLTEVSIRPVLDADGAPLGGEASDAEGLADLGDGRYAVSFEREHRIAVYDLGADWSAAAEAAAAPFPAPPGADRLRNNAGVEALARVGDRLYAGVEDPIISGQPHTLWVYDFDAPDTPPRALALQLEPGFGLTALAAGPEGGLYLIERFWARDVGNRIHVSRLSAEALDAPGAAPLRPQRLADIDPAMTVDNFEAITVRRADGETRLMILSDDNFNADQRTLLLAFALDE